MARVTVEDCIDKVPNRFGLVLLAAHRARAISAGGQILVDRDNDKNPVVALREVADDVVDADELKEALIGTLQRVDEHSEAEEEAETLALLADPSKRPRWRSGGAVLSPEGAEPLTTQTTLGATLQAVPLPDGPPPTISAKTTPAWPAQVSAPVRADRAGSRSMIRPRTRRC